MLQRYVLISESVETGQSRVCWCINHSGAESCSLVLGNQRSLMGIQTLIQFQSSAINICDMCQDTELSFIPKPDCSTTVFLLRWLVHSEDFNIVLMLA